MTDQTITQVRTLSDWDRTRQVLSTDLDRSAMMAPWSIPSVVENTNRNMAPATPAMSFGPFHLLPSQRLLLEGSRPLHIGSRALDILVALAERAGQLVSKRELMARIWPDTVVEDGNLKAQIAILRRVLRDGENEVRYISTWVGRGYWFVHPVMRSTILQEDTTD
jgi:DNA-binding winged helix-turn-helix (wHTH) protein